MLKKLLNKIKRYFAIEKIFHLALFHDEKSSIALKLGKHIKTYSVKYYCITGIFLTFPRKRWYVKMIIFPMFAIAQFLYYFIITGVITAIFAAVFVTIWNDVMPVTFNMQALNIGTIFKVGLLIVIPFALAECVKRFFKIK